MKDILVFVNFTEASAQAVKQASSFAKLHEGKLHLCHVSQGDHDIEVEKKLSEYAEEVKEQGAEVSILPVKGEFFAEAPAITKRIAPDVIIIGSVGEEGVSIGHFGSAVYRLVRLLPAPSLIVQGNSPLAENGYRKAMFPLSAHSNFVKVVKSLKHVMAADGKVTLFDVSVNGAQPDKTLAANATAAQDEMDRLGIPWSLKRFNVSKAPSGYADIILEETEKEGMDLIAMPADIAMRSLHFGKMDKESLIINVQGVPVLCLNTDMD